METETSTSKTTADKRAEARTEWVAETLLATYHREQHAAGRVVMGSSPAGTVPFGHTGPGFYVTTREA